MPEDQEHGPTSPEPQIQAQSPEAPQDISDISSVPANNSSQVVKVIIAASVLVGLFVGAYLIYNNNKVAQIVPDDELVQQINQSNSQAKLEPLNSIFLAKFEYGEGGVPAHLDVSIVDSVNNKIILNRKIQLQGPNLVAGSNSASNTNDAVQYDPVSGDVYYMTQGASEYDGSCINTDGTCFTRLFKYNLESGETKKIGQWDGFPQHWLLDNKSNTIFLDFITADNNITKQSLLKLDVESGQQSTVFFEVEISEPWAFGTLYIPRNSRILYQHISKNRNRADAPQLIRGFDIASKQYKDIEFSLRSGANHDTNLSPDGQHLVYWDGEWLKENLYILELQTKTVEEIKYIGRINNFNLIWSGDGKKVFYLVGSSLYSYDIETKQSKQLLDKQVYIFSASEKHLLYIDQKVGMVSTQDGQVISLPEDIVQTSSASSVVAAMWF